MVVGNQRYFFSYIAAHIQEGKKNAILVKDRYQAAAITTYLEALNIPVASQATPNITKGKAFHVLKLGLPPEFSDEGDFADYRQLLELVKQGRDLEELALLDEYDHPELKRVLATHPDAVHIITTHTSKGLEFDVVFALGTAFDLPEPNEESLRLLYVAATRAKETLHLFHDPEQTLSSTSLLFSKVPIPEHTPLTQECTVTPKKPYNTPPPVKTLPIDYPPPPRYLSFSAIANPNVRAEDRLHYPTTAELPPGKETGHLIHLQIERRIELGRPCTDLTGTSLAGKEALVDALIEQAFALPLDGFCLNDVPYQDMLQEHEFQYPHMKGFIDLVFRYKNRIYLIDWKTNLLPDYDEETLHKEMLAHDYYTQANIYKEALRQAGLPLVKSFYIFIRGPGVIHVD